MAEKLNAILMLEVIGKPADYLKQALGELIEKISKEKDVKIINQKIAEPKLLEQGIFSTFAEVEIETSMQTLMLLTFGYMPSHVDIITPEELKIRNNELNIFFNELARKLHQYDEIAKALMMERDMLVSQLKQAQGNSPRVVEQLAMPSKGKVKKEVKKKKR